MNIEDIEDVDVGEATLDLNLPTVTISQPPPHVKIFLPGDSFTSCSYGVDKDKCGGNAYHVGIWSIDLRGYTTTGAIWCENHLPTLRKVLDLPDL